VFVTSLPAAQDFGLFFAFTAAVRASARMVGRALTCSSRQSVEPQESSWPKGS
jgi:hypothetical protein